MGPIAKNKKRELESPIYFAFFNFLRFCEVGAAIYFAFSFFIAICGIETTAKLTNRSTHSSRGEQTESAIREPQNEPRQNPTANEWWAPHTRCPPARGKAMRSLWGGEKSSAA